MEEWEYLRVSVYYKEDDRIDFISKRGKTLSSIATHDGMETYFNVEQSVWESYLQKLKVDGWQLADLNKREDGRHEAYAFRRPKK
jgi:hypothetical protein